MPYKLASIRPPIHLSSLLIPSCTKSSSRNWRYHKREKHEKKLRSSIETIRKGKKNMSEDHLRNVPHSASHNISKILLKKYKSTNEALSLSQTSLLSGFFFKKTKTP